MLHIMNVFKEVYCVCVVLNKKTWGLRSLNVYINLDTFLKQKQRSKQTENIKSNQPNLIFYFLQTRLNAI